MSHDAKQDSCENEVGDEIVDKIDKEIYQDLSQLERTGDDKGTNKIPALSTELIISHFKSQDIFCTTIKDFATKRGDHVKVLKSKNDSNSSVIEIIPNTKNNNQQQIYIKYHLSIYCNSNSNDETDDKDETDDSDSESDIDDQSCELQAG